MKTKNTFSKECQNELQKQLPIIYKNRFKNHKLITLNYNGLLTDLKTYWNQDARFREGFEFTTDTVTIPTFFIKVDGVPSQILQASSQKKKKKLFEEEFDFLFNQKLTQVIKKCNICYIDSKNDINHFKFFKKLFVNFSISSENYFEIIKNLEIKEQLNLSKAKLELYFNKLSEFFCNIQDEITLLEKVILLKNLLIINPALSKLINMTDFGFEVPKLLIFDENKDLNKISAYAYYFLNYMGFDICFFSPSGKINIEKYFDLNEVNYGYFEEDLSFLDINKNSKIKTKKGFPIFKFISDFFKAEFFDMTLTLILLIVISIMFRNNIIGLFVLVTYNFIYSLCKTISIDCDSYGYFGSCFDENVETKLKKPSIYVKILISFLWGYLLILSGMIINYFTS